MASNSVRPKQNEVPPWASTRTSHLASLSAGGVAVDDSARAGTGEGRVHNFHGMTATSSGQQLARIFAGKELVESARPNANSMAAVADSAPFQAADAQPAASAPSNGPVVITGAKPIGFDKGLGSPGPTTKEESDRLQAEIDANDRRIRENNQQKDAPPPAPAAIAPPATTVAPPTAPTSDKPVENKTPPGPLPGQPIAPPAPPATPPVEGVPQVTPMGNGGTQTSTIVAGTGGQTIDTEVRDADGKVITSHRAVANDQGGVTVWTAHADGRHSVTYVAGAGQPNAGATETYTVPAGGDMVNGANEYIQGDGKGNWAKESADSNGDIARSILEKQPDGVSYLETKLLPDGSRVTLESRPGSKEFATPWVVGQMGGDGLGWRTDQQGNRWEIAPDGPNTAESMVDAAGNAVARRKFAPNGELLWSWSRNGQIVLGSTRGPDGKMIDTIQDLENNTRGRIENHDNGFRIVYDGGETVEFDKNGNEIDTRSVLDKTLDFANAYRKGVYGAAGGLLEGIGALTGANDNINDIGKFFGKEPNLTTKVEAFTGLGQSLATVFTSNAQARVKDFGTIYGFAAGKQGLGTTFGEIWDNNKSALNETSKLLIGTDWTTFSDDPGGTLGRAVFGTVTLFSPIKGGGAAAAGGETAAAAAQVGKIATGTAHLGDAAAIGAAAKAADKLAGKPNTLGVPRGPKVDVPARKDASPVRNPSREQGNAAPNRGGITHQDSPTPRPVDRTPSRGGTGNQPHGAPAAQPRSTQPRQRPRDAASTTTEPRPRRGTDKTPSKIAAFLEAELQVYRDFAHTIRSLIDGPRAVPAGVPSGFFDNFGGSINSGATRFDSAATPSPNGPWRPQKLLPALMPGKAAKSIKQVRNLKDKSRRWQEAEVNSRERYGAGPERPYNVPENTDPHFPIDKDTVRKVDVPVDLGNGRIIAIEVKMYQRYRRVEVKPGKWVTKELEVPLSPHIKHQIAKDYALRKADPGYDPMWEFLGAGPSPDLVAELARANIRYVWHM
ncbi:hypothetical protein [Nocardia suismassiliense]|uniref:hypothetical protein n=1 Tax=Nocardia suismassiliense TaxID=2077092 RepID=UPI000D1EB8B3|nr:hypothetical protein [Nocardia suismassiliense]